MENEIKVNKIKVTTKEQLDELYNGSAFTMEGFDLSKESINKLIEWFNEYGGVRNPLSIFITKGSFMNNEYGLTGDNAYPKDLNITSIKLEDIKEVNRVAIPRFGIGARWFSDIVDNNRVRQNKIDGIEEDEEEEY